MTQQLRARRTISRAPSSHLFIGASVGGRSLHVTRPEELA